MSETPRIISFWTSCENSSGETLYVEHDGKDYKIEHWATDNCSGIDVYQDGRPSADLDDVFPTSEFEGVDEFVQAFSEHYDALHEKYLSDLFDLVLREAISTFGK